MNLDENERSVLEERLQLVLDAKNPKPEVTLTWFIPDERKAGGRYVTHTGKLRKFDAMARMIVMEDGTLVPVDEVTDVQSKLLQKLVDE